jgi:hypothetical protein
MKIGTVIDLTDELSRLGEEVGRRRTQLSKERGFMDKHGAEIHRRADGGVGNDINAAKAEVAWGELARRSGLHVEWLAGSEKPHLGVDYLCRLRDGRRIDIEVRSTHHQKGGLLVHADDPDDCWAVLMIGSLNQWRYAGGMWVKEAKTFPLTNFGKEGRDPVHRVGQDFLRADGR